MRRSGPGAALVVVAAGLLVLVVALAVGSERTDLGDGRTPLIGEILSGVIVGSFFALVVVGLWILLFRRGAIERRKPTAPPVPWWIRSLVMIGLLVVAVSVGLLVFGGRSKPERERPTPQEQLAGRGQNQSSAADEEQSPVTLAFWVGAAAALGAVVFVIARGVRDDPDLDADPDLDLDELAPMAPLVRAVDASLDALEGEPDPRRAILVAYARVQDLLGQAGLPRRASETEPEYLVRVLAQLGAAAEPARRLTALFEVARYGTAPIDEAMRAEAIAAARALRDHAAVTTETR